MLAESITTCPHCGAENAAQATRCWLCHCGLAVPPVRDAPQKQVSQAAAVPPKFAPSTGTFSLAAIFAVVTLAAVGFGLARLELGLGITFAIIAIPAFIITAVRTRRERNVKGRDVGVLETILTFLASSAAVFGIMILIQIAIIIAVLIACLAICGGFMAMEAFSR